MTEQTKISRRAFLVTTGAAAAVTMGYGLVAPGQAVAGADALVSPSIFYDLHGDGRVVVHIAKAEMGQHVGTALAQILADELEADWDKVEIDYVGIDARHGLTLTGGSWSVNWTFDALSRAGAAGRIALIEAAAAKMGGAPEDYTAEAGVISGNGQSMTYGELIAAGVEPRIFSEDDLKGITLKTADQRRYVGQSIPQLDIPSKTDGTAQFGIDIVRPGMVVAVPIAPPVRNGATVKSVDDSAAQAMAGYQGHMVIDNPLAGHTGVVLAFGDSYWQANQATSGINIEYDLGPNAGVTLEAIHAESMRLIETGEEERIFVNDGDADAGISGAETVLKADYSTGLNIHAPLEPMCCTAEFDADGVLHLYAGNQFQTLVGGLAGAMGIEAEKLVLHQQLLGGGFGRKLDADYVMMSIMAAQQMGKPVKLLFSREFDTQMDFTRPASCMQLEAGLSGGKIVGWKSSSASSSASARQAPAFMAPDLSGDAEAKFDPFAVNGADHWYSIENQKALISLNGVAQAATPSGHLRAVAPGWQFFAVESFMDELANAAGADPLDFRLGMLDGAGKNAGAGATEGGSLRLAAMLKDVAERSGYGKEMADNEAIGVACVSAQERNSATWMACAAEVAVDPETGDVDVKKLTLAAELGTLINPDGVKAQIEGGALWGLSFAMLEDVTMEDGALSATNYDGMTPTRMENVPELDVAVHETGRYPVGIGEPATTVVGPAIANAIAKAVGARVRSLPITPEKVKAAMG
ncbi:molybdopterin cofactor-binding domain-containing protein [Pseudooceanicola sp. MF1-13]|uniref:xanthine dehydrogenase family protein molybdopterin-binding subunit n=1 Tax=Pseudooceanicola sp. MF1-13 TaxID=3379095 RepID=UPI003892ABE6